MAKVLIGAMVGFLLGLAVYRAPWGRLFADEPETPADWKPKMMYWINGVEQHD